MPTALRAKKRLRMGNGTIIEEGELVPEEHEAEVRRCFGAHGVSIVRIDGSHRRARRGEAKARVEAAAESKRAALAEAATRRQLRGEIALPATKSARPAPAAQGQPDKAPAE